MNDFSIFRKGEIYIFSIESRSDICKLSYCCGIIKCFCFFPWQSLFFTFQLNISCCKINTNSYSIIISIGMAFLNIFPILANTKN